jgi:uncharacterized repeat protein (TIGR03803 family)
LLLFLQKKKNPSPANLAGLCSPLEGHCLHHQGKTHMKRMLAVAMMGALLPTLSAAAAPNRGVRYDLLHAFEGGTADGGDPIGSLIDVKGTLYGTAYYGGANGAGAIFAIDAKTGAESLVYSFKGNGDAAAPGSGFIQVGGLLYGTTYRGGSGPCPQGTTPGCGTIYSFDPKSGVEKVLYNFQNGADGAIPAANLTNVGGTLYGTAEVGGAGSCTGGCGTVFSFDISTGVEKTIYAFKGGAIDGIYPEAPLLGLNGQLYGTTFLGGATNGGTLFAVDPATGAETFFQSLAVGASPSGMLAAIGTILYGTTQSAGDYEVGSIFALDTATKGLA